MNHRLIVAVGCAVAAVACGPSEHVKKLRSALDRSNVSLSGSVAVAETSLDNGVAVYAKLLVDQDAVFNVNALANAALVDVRVDIVSSKVLSTAPSTQAPPNCPGSIPLAQAISIAESEVGGRAVLIGADDDNACDREVQVLVDNTLMEVKEAPDGNVLEVEESDDDEGADD